MSKLLEEVSDLIRTLHYRYRTEEDLPQLD